MSSSAEASVPGAFAAAMDAAPVPGAASALLMAVWMPLEVMS